MLDDGQSDVFRVAREWAARLPADFGPVVRVRWEAGNGCVAEWKLDTSAIPPRWTQNIVPDPELLFHGAFVKPIRIIVFNRVGRGAEGWMLANADES